MSDSTRTFPLLLAGIGLLVVGVLLGRMTAPTTTTLAHRAPVDGQAAAASGPGPSRVENGVPVGYAHSRAGAVAAAANIAAALDRPAVLDASQRDEMLQVVAAEGARDSLEDRFADVAELLEERLSLEGKAADSSLVMRMVPAGYRVESYGHSSATVDLWAATVFVAPGHQPIPSSWATATVTLSWERGDWRVSDVSTTDGPVPPSPTNPQADPMRVAEQIRGFEPLHAVPEPVE